MVKYEFLRKYFFFSFKFHFVKRKKINFFFNIYFLSSICCFLKKKKRMAIASSSSTSSLTSTTIIQSPSQQQPNDLRKLVEYLLSDLRTLSTEAKKKHNHVKEV